MGRRVVVPELTRTSVLTGGLLGPEPPLPTSTPSPPSYRRTSVSHRSNPRRVKGLTFTPCVRPSPQRDETSFHEFRVHRLLQKETSANLFTEDVVFVLKALDPQNGDDEGTSF